MRGVKVEEKEWPIAVNHTKMRFSGAKSMDFQERTGDELIKQKRCVSKDVWQLTKDVFKLNKGIKRFVPVSQKSDISCPTLELLCIRLTRRTWVLESRRLSRDSDVLYQWLTANVEDQTNEEAQVNVHDLHIFVTVQLLEDSPAVLTLDKYCKEYGYTYEWPSGCESHLTNNGNQIFFAETRISSHW